MTADDRTVTAGASIELRRRLEWADTDASGHWHNATVWRYLEWAEGELHRRLGITDVTFGFTPRRRLEADFFRPIRFDDEVVARFVVGAVGRTSATYELTLEVDGATAATAKAVVVFIDASGAAAPWPAHVAEALRGEGGGAAPRVAP